MDLVQEVAFDHMDHRLANALLKQSTGVRTIKTTHQALAIELGTAREVVSRLLKEFERHGWVKLYRGRIEILNPEQLSEI
jgi:CRP/FNR family transcriptional regulator